MNIRIALSAAALSLATFSAAHAYDRSFTLVNSTGNDIKYVYVSHVDTTKWGRDILGSNTVLHVGYQIELEPDQVYGYCLFDIKLVYDNGEKQILKDVDLCTISRVEAVGKSYEAYTS